MISLCVQQQLAAKSPRREPATIHTRSNEDIKPCPEATSPIPSLPYRGQAISVRILPLSKCPLQSSLTWHISATYPDNDNCRYRGQIFGVNYLGLC